jgi:hypothetical protein
MLQLQDKNNETIFPVMVVLVLVEIGSRDLVMLLFCEVRMTKHHYDTMHVNQIEVGSIELAGDATKSIGYGITIHCLCKLCTKSGDTETDSNRRQRIGCLPR